MDFKDLNNLTRLAQIPKISVPTPVIFADTIYEQLRKHIAQVEKTAATRGHELSVQYTSPSGEPFLVRSFGYHNPFLIMLYGVDNQGNDCAILVHMSSMQLVLRMVAPQPDAPKRKIGFVGDVEKQDTTTAETSGGR